MNQKDKYVVLLVRKFNGIYAIVDKRKMRKTVSEITYKKKSYPLDFSKIIYRKGYTSFLLVDLDGMQLTVEGGTSPLSPQLFKAIVVDKLAQQLASSMGQGMAMMWLQIIIGIAIGVPIGYIIGLVIPV